MRINSLLFVLCLGGVFFSCSPKKEASEVLVEANEVHKEAVEIYDEAHELYETVKRNAADKKDSAIVARLDSIHDLLHSWKDGLYEVPGFEHDHDHEGEGHDHDHKHTVAPSMTDQSMLDYQKNAKEAIKEIRDTLRSLASN